MFEIQSNKNTFEDNTTIPHKTLNAALKNAVYWDSRPKLKQRKVCCRTLWTLDLQKVLQKRSNDPWPRSVPNTAAANKALAGRPGASYPPPEPSLIHDAPTPMIDFN